MAYRVRLALSDNELVDIFMGTLQGLYYEKIIGSSSTNFVDMVTIGERVENGLKSGKIIDTTAPQTTNKRSHGGFTKKKEGEANAITVSASPQYQFPMTHMSYHPYPYVVDAQYQQPPRQYQPQKGNQQSTPAQRNQNQQYNRDNKEQGRGQNNRNSFDIFTFSEEKPNVKTNSLTKHGGSAVNVVVEEETIESILRAKDVKTPMSVMLQRLEKFGFLAGVHDDCAVCEFDPDNCNELMGCVQELMDQGLIKKKKVEAPPKRIQPIHFRVPSLFPYQNTKAVHWNYETTAYLGGKEICIPDTEIFNIAEVGGMTRSGRVFAPKYHLRVSPAPTFIPHKKKVILIPTPQAGATVPAIPNMTTAPVPMKVIDNKAAESEVSKGKWPMVKNEQVEDYKKSITFEESQEFLKLIKKSDFKIVDQLNQTPSKISILSLLLSSEAHRKALLKVLNVAHVMQDITVDQFDDVVANITASRYLGFNEVELPPEGNAHNKALHIPVTCTDSLLSRVLVDTGSSLNILPKSTLSQLQFKRPEMSVAVNS
ncbi:uncharacterized protein LOC127137919 [Lathyrus oleraceus]|uniref:uncharacterized protein LOC127137919 n=1 Tax=Pisum sativum TaxID=3888 RepID=UPI0021CF5345|nr:uncharacterized protein LOC127137919 [Pisum sativum]